MKEFVVNIPEGYEIDKENSTFEKIVFKKVTEEPKRWRDDENANVDGYFMGNFGDIQKCSGNNKPANYNIFATEKQAKRAIAEARISQIMTNDKRFGGVITDEEWEDYTFPKCVIYRDGNRLCSVCGYRYYHFLAFHTKEQRDLFMEENMDLIKDYFMIE
jgi:hypothetical protein